MKGAATLSHLCWHVGSRNTVMSTYDTCFHCPPIETSNVDAIMISIHPQTLLIAEELTSG